MGFFTPAQMEQINQVAAKSKELLEPPKSSTKASSINATLNEMSANVIKYFEGSEAILITNKDELHEYVDNAIEAGYAGIDTETTGLDRIHDTIVGASLYYPGGVECYIPMKHLVPIFDEPYKNQMTYQDVGEEFQRLADSNIKLIFANADFDLAMIYKDLKVDFCDRCYYDVILAWRCLKENERDNTLKGLYNKYYLRGKGDPKKFSDFFTPAMFPYCKPEVAKLYAANDAKITYELFTWQLPYVTKEHPKCKKAHLEKIADLIWNVEIPLIPVCQKMHRTGMYLDKSTSSVLMERYHEKRVEAMHKLSELVDAELQASTTVPAFGKKPFNTGSDFNPNSPVHVKYLLYTVMNLPKAKGEGTGKEVLAEFNLPVTSQLLKVRSIDTLIGTFVDKLPKATTPDSRIHANFKQIGAATGRLSSESPNVMNIPSHSADIRHMFRATPGYVMLSSDYSRQEPAITAYVSGDKGMIDSFVNNKDIYASIASLAFNVPYEKCLEFHPDTKEYQPDGKARRNEAKTILLGISYGRAIPSIAEQLYNTRDDMSDEEKVKGAQKVYDSVMNAFPGLRTLMISSQKFVREYGYTETILGRRRHLPDMQLPEFDFKPLKGYVNPDIDPLDPSTLENKSDIPERVKAALLKELTGYKYFGQVAKRMRELHDDEHVQVLNNRPKINDATRQVCNCVSLDTEILTVNGWKTYNHISEGDEIFSYNLETQQIERDKIQAVNVSNEEIECALFNSPTFEAVSTMNHRWVVGEADEVPRIKETWNIYKNRWPDYPILRVAGNAFLDNPKYTDADLKLIGWVLTDGQFHAKPYDMWLFQSTKHPKNADIYAAMMNILDQIGLKHTDTISKDGYYHSIYINKCDYTDALIAQFPDHQLTVEFISSLSQHQAEVVMWSMIEADGTLGTNRSNITYTAENRTEVDLFQYLAFVAGYATNAYETTPEVHNAHPSSNKCYDSVSNSEPIHATKSYYIVSILRIRRAQIYPHHKSTVVESGVWCPTTGNSTWVARYHNKVFITGNSIIQGSAADMSKLAILNLETDPEWKAIGGRLLTPIHDELCCEVPIEYWKEGGEILSRCMLDAASFLPFSMKCDVTTTLRWYGLEYPCQYPKPDHLENISPDEVKWVQYQLHELEYILPVYKDENGEKPRGDAALGVNGVVSDEYYKAIQDYKNRYSIQTDAQFIEDIERRVVYGE